MKLTNFNTFKYTAIALVAITGISVSATNLFLSSKPVQADNVMPTKIAQNSVKMGKFMTVQQEKQTTGKFKVITENGKRYLEFSSDFSTATGPDVQVILHRNNEIGVNPKEKEYVTLAMLKSFEGAQRYLIPDNINLKDFKSVGIWCRKFNVTFAFATIKG